MTQSWRIGLMRIKAVLAMLVAATLASAGCTGMRNRDRSMRDPVQLPAAPKIEQTPTGTTPPSLGGASTTGANMSGPSVSPLSATATDPSSLGARR
jgi:hypothetical protein